MGLKYGTTPAALDCSDCGSNLLCGRWRECVCRRGFCSAHSGCWPASDAGASLQASSSCPPRRTQGAPRGQSLRLELGRAYLSAGADGRAIRLFREILGTEPDNRLAKLELARALGFTHQFQDSSEIYRELLEMNPADEAAAIGLASNLLHQQRSPEARDVVDRALTFHSNSLRLQEYKDRIESGQLGGEELEVGIRRNSVETEVDYVNDSAGNHSWRSAQRVEFDIKPDLTRIPAAISANAWLVRCGMDHFSRVPASGFTDQHLPQRAALRRRCALLAKTTDTHPGDDRAAPAGDVADRRSRRDPDSSPCGFRVACPRRQRCNAEWGDTQPLNNAGKYSPAESEVTLRS